jgi:hypothetical protein
MNSKPFIHPDILITIKESLNDITSDKLEDQSYSNAKHSGEEFAAKVLQGLFHATQEYGNIQSHFNTERLSSEKLVGIREQIVAMHYQRKAFGAELVSIRKQEAEQAYKYNKLKSSFFNFLYKKRIQRYESELIEIRDKVEALVAVNTESYITLRFEYESKNVRDTYSDFTSAFATLKSASKIWDVVMTQINIETKAAAGTTIDRNEVKVDFKGIDVIQTTDKVLHVENFNGGDFYFYPNFIVYFKNNDEIALIDYSDLYILFEKQRFLEESKDIPTDTMTIGETWYRVNKDGSPDKRFASNYKIPIVQYGSLHFKTASGVNEMYYISNAEKAEHFVLQFRRYQSLARKFR